MLALIHRWLAHELYLIGLPLLARILAELAHSETGIDIHPGDWPGCFIDHGTGVVIGETAIIGQNVRIYHGDAGRQTLSKRRARRAAEVLAAPPHRGGRRGHLRGATILGRVTIGQAVVIGGNVWITHDVAPGAHVHQASVQHEQRTLPGAARTAVHGAAPAARSRCPKPMWWCDMATQSAGLWVGCAPVARVARLVARAAGRTRGAEPPATSVRWNAARSAPR